ncbi:MAG: FAD:protein FMN transferase [Verrucomicrobiota bacterium]|jgi:thiamine biosynthesis lipoprotein
MKLRRWRAWLLLPLWLGTVSCVTVRQGTPALTRYEYERPEMGVPFRLVLYAPDQAGADQAAEAAFRRVQQLNDSLSDYEAESELSKLSRTSGQGREIPVSDDLWFVLRRAQALAERSGGAFDITVGPCVNLWRRARRQHQLPDPARLAQARKAVGYQHVRLNPKRQAVELLVADMRLDLGGIGKGYAVDEALKSLKRLGLSRALVEGGGDVVVGDPPPGKPAWRIELAPLDVTNAPPARFLLLKNAAISTSGDLYQRLEIEGKRYSHIIDPGTGIGLTNHSLVNVIAPQGITADSLTKVVSVLGPQKGLKLVEATPGAAARVMRNPDEKLETYESSRFKRYYERGKTEALKR